MTGRFQRFNWILKLLLVASIAVASMPSHSVAQIPPLPSDRLTTWEVRQPQEIVTWVIVDPATIESSKPSEFRFVSVQELANIGVSRAQAFLSSNPPEKGGVLTLLEVVRSEVFQIDGEAPSMPEHGAVGLWFAPVAPKGAEFSLDGEEQSILALEVWLPDSSYVRRIRDKGHYATPGRVTLRVDANQMWRGTIDVPGLSVVGECVPTGPIRGGVDASGRQMLIPPRPSGIEEVVRIAYAGHRIQSCEDSSAWEIKGIHPLAAGIVYGPAEFQFGYRLTGGAYSR